MVRVIIIEISISTLSTFEVLSSFAVERYVVFVAAVAIDIVVVAAIEIDVVVFGLIKRDELGFTELRGSEI